MKKIRSSISKTSSYNEIGEYWDTHDLSKTWGKTKRVKFDEFVKSPKWPFSVIPAKAGIQLFQAVLDPGFRRGDDLRDFLRDHQV